MKIRLTTDIGVWIDGQPRGEGYEADLDAVVAKAIIENGFAQEVRAKRASKDASNAE